MSVWPHIAATGRRIGYARVSTKDQKLRMQLDALHAINCDLIFEDHGVSGGKASRDGLDKLLAEAKSGDTVHQLAIALRRSKDVAKCWFHTSPMPTWFEKPLKDMLRGASKHRPISGVTLKASLTSRATRQELLPSNV